MWRMSAWAVMLTVGCGGEEKAADTGDGSDSASVDSGDSIAEDTGAAIEQCDTLFAAVMASTLEVGGCDAALPGEALGCAAGTTPNACSEQLWQAPVAGSDPGGLLKLAWAPRCAGGDMDCAPSDPQAVTCADGTRAYYYVAPGETADGSPSRRWFFRWHNGQVSAEDIAGGCGFDGTCDDPLGSQRPGGVDQSLSAEGLFAEEPPPDGAWLTAYNRVYFTDPCIVDYYGGDRAHEASVTDAAGVSYRFPFQFRGANFIDGVFAQLSRGESGVSGVPALSDAELIVLYAWSGGGRHVIQNLDRLAHDADGDGVSDGGLLGGLAPEATVRGVVSSRFQPGVEVQGLFAEVDEALARPDVDGAYTGAYATFEESESAGTIYDSAVSHGALWESPLPTHDGACPGAAPAYPPFDGGTCWSEGPVMSNATFRDGLMAQLLDGWGYRRDASCLLSHPDAPETCSDFQHVLLNHTQGDLFLYISQHDQAYRSPTKLPTYADDPDYYWSPDAMRQRVRKQLADFARYRWTGSELATGADPSCGAGGCEDGGFAVFAPDLYLHDDPVNSLESGFEVQLCDPAGAGGAISLAAALGAWSERGGARSTLFLVDGVDGVGPCEDGADADGDGLAGCDDPEWAYRLAEGSDTALACE